jgi:hypothetical protein
MYKIHTRSIHLNSNREIKYRLEFFKTVRGADQRRKGVNKPNRLELDDSWKIGEAGREDRSHQRTVEQFSDGRSFYVLMNRLDHAGVVPKDI